MNVIDIHKCLLDKNAQTELCEFESLGDAMQQSIVTADASTPTYNNTHPIAGVGGDCSGFLSQQHRSVRLLPFF